MNISGHNIPHVALGGFILVVGFMAFNGGSQASISQPGMYMIFFFKNLPAKVVKK